MSKSVTATQVLQRARERMAAGEELSVNQKRTVLAVLDERLDDSNMEKQFQNFRRWIARGTSILDGMQQEMERMKTVTAPDADLISRQSIMEILESYSVKNPENTNDNTVNWLLGRLTKDIAGLPARNKNTE